MEQSPLYVHSFALPNGKYIYQDGNTYQSNLKRLLTEIDLQNINNNNIHISYIQSSVANNSSINIGYTKFYCIFTIIHSSNMGFTVAFSNSSSSITTYDVTASSPCNCTITVNGQKININSNRFSNNTGGTNKIYGIIFT